MLHMHSTSYPESTNGSRQSTRGIRLIKQKHIRFMNPNGWTSSKPWLLLTIILELRMSIYRSMRMHSRVIPLAMILQSRISQRVIRCRRNIGSVLKQWGRRWTWQLWTLVRWAHWSEHVMILIRTHLTPDLNHLLGSLTNGVVIEDRILGNHHPGSIR